MEAKMAFDHQCGKILPKPTQTRVVLLGRWTRLNLVERVGCKGYSYTKHSSGACKFPFEVRVDTPDLSRR